MTCWLCVTLPTLVSGSTLTAAVHAQLCGDCGATLGIHAPEHPHPTLYCPGFQYASTPAARTAALAILDQLDAKPDPHPPESWDTALSRGEGAAWSILEPPDAYKADPCQGCGDHLVYWHILECDTCLCADCLKALIRACAAFQFQRRPPL